MRTADERVTLVQVVQVVVRVKPKSLNQRNPITTGLPAYWFKWFKWFKQIIGYTETYTYMHMGKKPEFT